MKFKHILTAIAATPFMMNAQQVMTPEIMWTLNRLGVQSVSPDNSSLIYKISKTDLKTDLTMTMKNPQSGEGIEMPIKQHVVVELTSAEPTKK